MFKMILVSFFLPMEIIPKHIFYFAVNCLHRSWFFSHEIMGRDISSFMY